jgi:hypothetical protein
MSYRMLAFRRNAGLRIDLDARLDLARTKMWCVSHRQGATQAEAVAE